MPQTSVRDGSAAIIVLSRTVWFNADVVSTRGAAPVTVKVSETLPTSRIGSTRAVTSALTTIFSRTTARKPCSSARTAYTPGTSRMN